MLNLYSDKLENQEKNKSIFQENPPGLNLLLIEFRACIHMFSNFLLNIKALFIDLAIQSPFFNSFSNCPLSQAEWPKMIRY